MNDELFIGLVKQLNDARKAQEFFTGAKKDWEQQWMRDPEYLALVENLKSATEQVSTTEKMLKSQLIDAPDYTPPFKAAWLVNSEKVSIDDEKALAWAKVYMAAAVSEVIDKKMLTDFAKKNPAAAPYAVITEGKEARIASDLSKFVDDAPF